MVAGNGKAESGYGRVERGGSIPDSPGQPAFTLIAASPSRLPVLIAVPHAGRVYPPSLVARMRNPGFAIPRLEDRHADSLGEAVARATGADLLVAHAPRAMLDLNRAPDDVDWDMFAMSRPAGLGHVSGRRAGSGLGLVPRRLAGLGELWQQRHCATDLEQRLAGVHVPYHAVLGAELATLRARWGVALLIDLHSMPPLPLAHGRPPARFVVGDRFGASCNGALVAAAFAHFAREGQLAAHNRPYAGGYTLDRHAAPERGIHAIQIEVDRSLYLDARLDSPDEGIAETAAVLAGLVRVLAAESVRLGSGGLAAAAE